MELDLPSWFTEWYVEHCLISVVKVLQIVQQTVSSLQIAILLDLLIMYCRNINVLVEWVWTGLRLPQFHNTAVLKKKRNFDGTTHRIEKDFHFFFTQFLRNDQCLRHCCAPYTYLFVSSISSIIIFLAIFELFIPLLFLSYFIFRSPLIKLSIERYIRLWFSTALYWCSSSVILNKCNKNKYYQ